MATAVETQPTPSTSSNANSTSKLLVSSVVGAAFILGGIVLAGYGIPKLLSNLSLGNAFITAFIRIVAQIAVIGGLAYLGGKIAGSNPPKGLRGGIFLVISVIIAWFFIVRAIGLNFGPAPGAIAAAALGALGIRFLTTKRGIGYMHSLEEQGWFHTNAYKRSQGRRLRQYTIMGLLVLTLSGVYSMMHRDILPAGDLVYKMPFGLENFTALTDQQYSVPLLLGVGAIWLAWRTVNIPTFADFLIATEAEMNKVSWSSRKRLFQDTIVVLVTTLLLTLFLLVIDLFSGWLLSDALGVLPKADPNKKKADATQQSSW
jgi:preprotein translocase SecE subunit